MIEFQWSSNGQRKLIKVTLAKKRRVKRRRPRRKRRLMTTMTVKKRRSQWDSMRKNSSWTTCSTNLLGQPIQKLRSCRTHSLLILIFFRPFVSFKRTIEVDKVDSESWWSLKICKRSNWTNRWWRTSEKVITKLLSKVRKCKKTIPVFSFRKEWTES